MEESSPQPVVADVQEVAIGRLYLPEGTGNYALLIFFGGSDDFCRQLCADIGCGVLSSSAEDAVSWAVEHGEEIDIDPARVGVGGSDAARIASACSRDVIAQLLLHPTNCPDPSDLPPALVVLSKEDEEGRAYVRKLETAGVKVYEQLYNDASSDLARENIALAMKKLLGV